MCGRYFIDPSQGEVISVFEQLEGLYGQAAFRSGEIFPTNNCPAYVDGEGLLRPELMVWGLPQYKGSGAIINVRESI